MRHLKSCIWVNEDETVCGQLAEGFTDYCGTHNHALRKEAKNAAKVKVVKPIRKVSAKMAKEKVVYNEKKAKYLEIFPICQAKGCSAPSTDLHHRQGRGKKLTDETLFLALCHDHHVYYTEHSAEAIADGISLLRSVSEPHKI